MPAKTKQCEHCETTIAESETKCPSCGCDLAELEENIKAITQANAVIAKRKAKETPTPAPTPEPAKPVSRFARLAALRRK